MPMALLMQMLSPSFYTECWQPEPIANERPIFLNQAIYWFAIGLRQSEAVLQDQSYRLTWTMPFH